MADSFFPANVCDLIVAQVPTWTAYPLADTGSLADRVIDRPLQPNDADGAVGVYAGEWTPSEYEIGGSEPTMQRYTLLVENMTKGANTPEVRAVHSRRAKILRAMLYRDGDLRVALGELAEELGGVTERFGRFGVTRQRFFTREVSGTFLHLAQAEVWVETNS
jgi:hypothetical protein